MESNYETLKLHTQLGVGVGAYHGTRIFPSQTTAHRANPKSKSAPVIDYFDYVNPADAEDEEEKEEEKSSEETTVNGSWYDEVVEYEKMHCEDEEIHRSSEENEIYKIPALSIVECSRESGSQQISGQKLSGREENRKCADKGLIKCRDKTLVASVLEDKVKIKSGCSGSENESKESCGLHGGGGVSNKGRVSTSKVTCDVEVGKIGKEVHLSVPITCTKNKSDTDTVDTSHSLPCSENSHRSQNEGLVVVKRKKKRTTADVKGYTKANLTQTADMDMEPEGVDSGTAAIAEKGVDGTTAVSDVNNGTGAENDKVVRKSKTQETGADAEEREGVVSDSKKKSRRKCLVASTVCNKRDDRMVDEQQEAGNNDVQSGEKAKSKVKDVSDVVQTRITSSLQNLTSKPEYRTALQVDTSYTTGVSSDSNCSQYSASSWTSEQDTSSSIDPSPNAWNYYVDSGVSFGTTSTSGLYSDASDVSGEDCCTYEAGQMLPLPPYDRRHGGREGKCYRRHSRYNRSSYMSNYNNSSSYNMYNNNNNDYSQIDFSGAIQNDNGTIHNMTVYGTDEPCLMTMPSQSYDPYLVGEYVDMAGWKNACEQCLCCAYATLDNNQLCENLTPGDVFYYSFNSMVVCVKQSRNSNKDLNIPQVGYNYIVSVICTFINHCHQLLINSGYLLIIYVLGFQIKLLTK